MNDGRSVALKVLTRMERDKAYASLALDAELDRNSGIPQVDRALATELIYGTVSRSTSLDYFIKTLSSVPMNRMSPGILAVLRMSLYQLIYLDKIPPSAACNEGVRLAKTVGGQKSGGFVNAVLRSFLRRKDELLQSFEKEPLWVRYSVSKDIAEIIGNQYGEQAEDILRAMFMKPFLSLSVNTIKTDALTLAEKLGGNKTDEDMVVIGRSGDVRSLYGFDDGLFFVQDRSSAEAVHVLDPKEGDTVIDLCAAPGGKSFKAAIMMKNKGRILSFDIHESKMSLINNSAKRLGLSIIDSRVHDAGIYDPSLLDIADKIICDVPCSGLGVIAKKPDIRYKTYESIEALTSTQLSILKNAAKYVKNGGDIVYSTCTINKHENEDIIDKFLTDNGKFKLNEIKTLLPDGQKDGFFYAKLHKC
ncbi:MAG: 16S rRNA (cytosine(967)-C(5))-methyltransferase RsmB [Bacillota bacterium]|nr:16S rRNA (cytosine(967)-C(5))-methyltransferase RsmB [Bacillota bacterium]